MDFNRIRLLSFDCYGTLVDWKKSVLDILEPYLEAKQVRASREAIFELFLQEDRKMTTGQFLPYREILTGIMEGIAGHLGIRTGTADRNLLSDHFDRWLPFPDTLESLKKLGERFRLAIISNVDDDLFSVTSQLLGVEFDHIITAGQLGSYKPARIIFDAALERFQLDTGRFVHVAQSLHHDIIPANKLDWNTVWVNRYGEPERTDRDEFPDLEVPDLASLVRIIDFELKA
jgi:2-haloacid dehalogenase